MEDTVGAIKMISDLERESGGDFARENLNLFSIFLQEAGEVNLMGLAQSDAPKDAIVFYKKAQEKGMKLVQKLMHNHDVVQHNRLKEAEEVQADKETGAWQI
ncbi:hypothetical protein ACJX0J_017823, partial [Zea mays]